MELDGRDPKVRDLIAAYEAATAAVRRGENAAGIAGFRWLIARVGEVWDANRAGLASAVLHQLSYNVDDRLTDEEVRLAEEIAASARDGSEAAWTVRFALGDATRRDDPAVAMDWYDQANGLRRAALAYDADKMDRVFDALIATFDGATVERLSALTGATSPKPVFVVGMPRSGTTLVEQVLASVPGVHGAGELTVLSQLARNIQEEEGAWPAGASQLTASRLTRLGTAYLTHIHKLAPKATRVVDKMPANAQNVGLILSIFPNATILHVRRDPLDNCFGCYRQLFSGGVDYCYDQTELGRYHQGLERAMAHWKAVAPGRIHDVDYGRLVCDFEDEARRLVAAAGMPWSDACLEFHKTERVIDTASSKQARQPLFTSGLGSSERFRPYLRDLETALAA